MLPNQSPPGVGADFVCLSPWRIYMLRGERWIAIGLGATRADAETQAQRLRRSMPGYRFAVAWSQADAA